MMLMTGGRWWSWCSPTRLTRAQQPGWSVFATLFLIILEINSNSATTNRRERNEVDTLVKPAWLWSSHYLFEVRIKKRLRPVMSTWFFSISTLLSDLLEKSEFWSIFRNWRDKCKESHKIPLLLEIFLSLLFGDSKEWELWAEVG